jgi:hypothetical protein
MDKAIRYLKPSQLKLKWITVGNSQIEEGWSFQCICSASVPFAGLNSLVYQPTGMFNSFEECKQFLSEFISDHFSSSQTMLSQGKLSAFIFQVQKMGSYSQTD